MHERSGIFRTGLVLNRRRRRGSSFWRNGKSEVFFLGGGVGVWCWCLVFGGGGGGGDGVGAAAGGALGVEVWARVVSVFVVGDLFMYIHIY